MTSRIIVASRWRSEQRTQRPKIARLREALLEARTVVEDNDVLFAIDRALKPDTGKKS